MNLVCTGFRYKAHRASGFTALLGGGPAGLDLEFLQRIWKWQGYIAVVCGILVMGAVQRERDCRVQPTGHGITRRSESVSAVAIGNGGRRRAAGESDQVDDLPSVQ